MGRRRGGRGRGGRGEEEREEEMGGEGTSQGISQLVVELGILQAAGLPAADTLLHKAFLQFQPGDPHAKFGIDSCQDRLNQFLQAEAQGGEIQMEDTDQRQVNSEDLERQN